jgi:hypothetical protein
MDDQLTESIRQYLDTPEADRDITEGAKIMLRLNRNTILYQNVLRKPEKLAAKVEYELKKYLKLRLDKMTVEDVVRMERVTVPAAAEDIAEGQPVVSSEDELPEGTVAKGKRDDHDELPEEIQNYWIAAGELFFKIKQLFEQLKGMEDAQACDRYEYLKQLDEADKQYRAYLAAYDNYDPDNADNTEVVDEVYLAKQVSAARKYISVNKGRLGELKESDPDMYVELLKRIQIRIDFLEKHEINIEESTREELRSLGLKA